MSMQKTQTHMDQAERKKLLLTERGPFKKISQYDVMGWHIDNMFVWAAA